MAQKCVHKGCGKVFTDPEEPCTYHPGPPEFHEGQKGWKCCKPRVLTFDEFLTIPPCTTGVHSTIDDTPAPAPKQAIEPTLSNSAPTETEIAQPVAVPRLPQAQNRPSPSPAPPESEDDDPALEIPEGRTCRRRGCGSSYVKGTSRDGEKCVHHPGVPLFHEGSKGYTCCKRRVLEFDQFLKLEGCKTKDRHLYVGSGKKGSNSDEEKLDTVRSDFYQTSTRVIASLYLKKISPEKSTVKFASPQSISLDLLTADNKRYATEMALFAPIDPEKSSFKIMGTKLELELEKADGSGWPVLKADDPHTGEIIQAGRAGRV